MTDEYQQGLRDGKLQAIESMQVTQNRRMENHERRLQSAERILYGLIGALALVQIIPIVKGFI